ncbi:MAG: S49 family peptidase [Gammaproteobacteria bacterium]|nr:S49 family peptidase [Gammaproteobacteria bacterium]
MSAFELAASQTWLILPDALDNILSIAQRSNDVEALETRLGKQLEHTHTVTNRNGVAVIPVTGPIFRYANLFTRISGATSTEVLATDIQTALDDPSIKSIVLNIDSPGGVASGINELANLIYQGRDKKKIAAYIGGTGASAAYWIASAAHEIVIDDIGLAGSIGAALNVKLDKKDDGSTTYEIVSSNAPNKRPDLATEAGRAKLGEMVDSLGSVFQQKVALHLGVDPEQIPVMGDLGGIRVGADAVTHGLAHRLGSLESLITELSTTHQPIKPWRPTTMTKTVVKTTAELHAALAAGTDAQDIVIAEAPTATLESFDLTEVKAEAAKAERERVTAITQLAGPEFQAEIDAAIENGDSAETAAMTILKAGKERGISLSGIKSDSTSAAHQSPASDDDKVAEKRTGLVGLMLKGAGVK